MSFKMFWLTSGTGKADKVPSKQWDASVRTLREMGSDESANKNSVELAAVIVNSLCTQGVPNPPIPSLDEDGDVVLTWHMGRLKGSALVADGKFSAVVTEGRKIAYLGPERAVNILTLSEGEFLGFGGEAKCRLVDRTEALASTTSRSFEGKSYFHQWDRLTAESTALLVTRTSSSSKSDPETSVLHQ